MKYIKTKEKGLSNKVICEISSIKNEPDWMLEKRLSSLDIFSKKPLPLWGPDLTSLSFNEISFFQKADTKKEKQWKNVPKEILETYEKIGIPKAEKKYLAGSVAQFESESIYENLKKKWVKQGIIFSSLDTALIKYPDLVKRYFMTTCVPLGDNKFSALHGAVWSGGSFVYVPKNVKLEIPLQTYFWMNEKNTGQFEHTIIIADEGASVHYIEGCTAPLYDENSLHSAVVEIFVGKGAKVRYTTIQNWSKNIYNLNTKRAIVEEEGQMEWVSGSLGSKVSMLYPCSILNGRGAKANHLSISICGEGQVKDTGAKVIHKAPNTSSLVQSKSISLNGGASTFRGLIKVLRGASGSVSHMSCDSIILDKKSKSNSIPRLEIDENDVTVSHEARIGKIGDEQLFYLRTRGFSEREAISMIVNGFLSTVTEKLPLEYAIELNRLVEMEVEK